MRQWRRCLDELPCRPDPRHLHAVLRERAGLVGADHGGAAERFHRGQAADEALDHVIAALDRATLDGAPFLRVIHGHGTGKLKVSLRAYLKDSPYVAAIRPGDRAEGGDGVTIVSVR